MTFIPSIPGGSIMYDPYDIPATTPPFLRSNQRTTYEELSDPVMGMQVRSPMIGDDPAYTQLEEELRNVLRARRDTGMKSRLGGILRGGLSAAAMPNRAYGGPMDTIAAIAGGIGGAQDQDILQQKLFAEEQARQARTIQAMLEERRRKAVADAQAGSYDATRAYREWQMNKPTADGYTFLSGSNGAFLKANKNTGETEMIQGGTPPVRETEAQKATARLKVTMDGIAQVEADLAANKIDEAGAAVRLKALGALVPEKERKNNLTAAAITRLNARGVLNPDPVQVVTEEAKLRNELYPKRGNKGNKPTTTEVVSDAVSKVHAAYQQASGVTIPGDDKARKEYYQNLLTWFSSNPAIETLIGTKAYKGVLDHIQTNASRALPKTQLRGRLGDVAKKGAATPPPLKVKKVKRNPDTTNYPMFKNAAGELIQWNGQAYVAVE